MITEVHQPDQLAPLQLIIICNHPASVGGWRGGGCGREVGGICPTCSLNTHKPLPSSPLPTRSRGCSVCFLSTAGSSFFGAQDLVFHLHQKLSPHSSALEPARIRTTPIDDAALACCAHAHSQWNSKPFQPLHQPLVTTPPLTSPSCTEAVIRPNWTLSSTHKHGNIHGMDQKFTWVKPITLSLTVNYPGSG